MMNIVNSYNKAHSFVRNEKYTTKYASIFKLLKKYKLFSIGSNVFKERLELELNEDQTGETYGLLLEMIIDFRLTMFYQGVDLKQMCGILVTHHTELFNGKTVGSEMSKVYNNIPKSEMLSDTIYCMLILIFTLRNIGEV